MRIPSPSPSPSPSPWPPPAVLPPPLPLPLTPPIRPLPSGSADRQIRAWSVVTGACLGLQEEPHLDSVFCIANLTPGYVASGSWDGSIAVHQVLEQPWEGDPLRLSTTVPNVAEDAVWRFGVHDSQRNVLWSGSWDGSVTRHDFHSSCTPRQECQANHKAVAPSSWYPGVTAPRRPLPIVDLQAAAVRTSHDPPSAYARRPSTPPTPASTPTLHAHAHVHADAHTHTIDR